jgi:hypothetical protein
LQADAPLERLQRAVREWNAHSEKDYRLDFVWGIAPYVTGRDIDDRPAQRRSQALPEKAQPRAGFLAGRRSTRIG